MHYNQVQDGPSKCLQNITLKDVHFILMGRYVSDTQVCASILLEISEYILANYQIYKLLIVNIVEDEKKYIVTGIAALKGVGSVRPTPQ